MAASSQGSLAFSIISLDTSLFLSNISACGGSKMFDLLFGSKLEDDEDEEDEILDFDVCFVCEGDDSNSHCVCSVGIVLRRVSIKE
ncbi:hypothetical protein TRFO_07473 [Tritrichomonas foetus]|uniref:Uncharacterized protein n=1 Tax=Tritrichomonas foetus TaxID=1144522 RepID=A0A1J4JRD5_9EUKA|nr:hypothetical protein TRFO_07473 [Tritrichomonas foetus]|eukprot:OHT01587.1 hypothetical protein TRFO_07473 [Tritrichomonas foetus]